MKRYTPIVLAMALVVAVAGAIPATAAEAAKAPDFAVQLWPEGEANQLLVIVSAQPAAGTKPATLDLPLIDGAKVLWVGEVLGGDPNSDVQQAEKIVDVKGGKALRVQLTKGKSAQYEATVPGFKISGATVSGSLKWIQTVAANKTSFSVRLPASINGVSIRPAPAGNPQRNSAGESLYTLPDRAIKTGDQVTVDVSYKKGAATSPAAGGETSLKSVLPWILGVIVVILAAIAVVLQKRAQNSAEE